MNESIAIPLSKIKLGFFFWLGTLFVVFGIWMTIDPAYWVIESLAPAGFVRTVGIVSMLFFGFVDYFIGTKLFDEKTGLTIDEEGITDNSSAMAAGLVRWEDITGFRVVQSFPTKTLLLETRDPEKYIGRAENKAIEQLMRLNHKLYGSPVSIVSTTLRIDVEELERLISDRLKQHQGGKLA